MIRDEVHFVGSPMPTTQASDKLPFAARMILPRSCCLSLAEAALRLAELEQENRQLRDDLRHLQSALASAVGLLLPYASRLNGSQ